MSSDIKLLQGDCLELIKEIPDGSVDLVLTDPPYGINVTTRAGGRAVRNEWDRIDDYGAFIRRALGEFHRVLKPSGVLYLWHGDMAKIARIVCGAEDAGLFRLVSFNIWDKEDGYRAQTWRDRRPDGRTSLRSWFNVCEYCLHFFKVSREAEAWERATGTERIHSNPECFRPIKDWYRRELERLGLTKDDVLAKYREATGRGGFMLRHYFQDSQFEIPTREVWEKVYEPLGFDIRAGSRRGYEALRQEYEALRQEYEALRQEYEALRHTHHVDPMHCNVWRAPPLAAAGRLHTCQKPLPLVERIVRVSSNPGDVVLDCFMGSGTTGVACVNTGRKFIGMELDERYFEIAERRIADAQKARAEELDFGETA